MKQISAALLNSLLILSLLSPFVGVTYAQKSDIATESSSEMLEGLGAVLENQRFPGVPISDGGPFRTHVTYVNTLSRSRLDELEAVVLEEDDQGALVLVDAKQLEDLARLGFRPQVTEGLDVLLSSAPPEMAWLAHDLQPLVTQAEHVLALASEGESLELAAREDLRTSMQSLTAEERVGIASVSAVDDDADGLTNVQESWWCTDPLDPDSDGDGATDADEVAAAKAWLRNETAGPPASGKPFIGWPTDHPGCYDDDQDSIPDMAERWELGLNMNRESTDRDKFDDGQELFGNTYCPGSGGYCGYGALPRNEDWGVIFAEMPAWVEKPGDHPFIAAFPVPEIDVVESSFHVETVTTVTTDHVISEGTEKAYSTSKMEGTSTSVSNTKTWNEWEEVSDTTPQSPNISQYAISDDTSLSSQVVNYQSTSVVVQQPQQSEGFLSKVSGLTDLAELPGKVWNAGRQIGEGINEGVYLTTAYGAPWNWNGHMDEYDEMQMRQELAKCRSGETCRDPATGALLLDGGQYAVEAQNATCETQNYASGTAGRSMALNGSGATIRPSYPIEISVEIPPVPTHTETRGKSWGGSEATTNESYEEHTTTNTEAFSNSESWGTAVAEDSSHAADLWFSYKVSNVGTEYAREIGDLAFNIYIGDNPNPAYTYFVGPDLGGDGVFHNFMPGEEHSYTSRRIPLTLEQMKAVDLGEPLRIVVEDYSYGIDELFYADAVSSSVMVAVEDGVADSDETIDRYLIPTWDDETVLDVLARYFPHRVDANGTLVAVWTREHRTDIPAWCAEPARAGNILWCKHALSTADWWNIYTDGLGDGTEGFQDTRATAGATALFRFNQDSDRDGYSDRSEVMLGTNPNDARSQPFPELLAGVHNVHSGNNVVATLSMLNSGLYDAYSVEAVMIAPDDSISITNNTVGGSGRVRALKDVIVGSRVLEPSYNLANWQGSAKPFSAGYYTGEQDRVYTFLALDAGVVGTGTVRLQWDDGLGTTGSLNFGSGYASPNPLVVGDHGAKMGMISGGIQAGDTFTVAARTPRDTFQYTINREPHTEPIVVVSYNDPQGNHRFIVPPDAMNLSSPTDDLITYAGEMYQDPGVEIVTTEPFTTGLNTTNLVVNNPSGVTLTEAHLFLEFVNLTGTVASEVPVTVTLSAGPNVIPVTWSTDAFSPTFQSEEDYLVIAFWTDWQGNIIDITGRPLSTFKEDLKPLFTLDEDEKVWGFGEVKQGTLLKRSFTLANVGMTGLLTYVGGAPGVTLLQTGSRNVGPADTVTYEIALDTSVLSVGAYDQTISIRTSDAEDPVATIHITGNITASVPDSPVGSIQRPLDWDAYISGSHSQGEWVQFTHTLGPDTQTLDPIKVFSQNYNLLWGVGRYATPFGEGTASHAMFGDGSDGDLTVTSGQTFYTDNVRTRMSSSASLGQRSVDVASTSGFQVGDEILVIQMQGTGVGRYEFGMISGIDSGRLTLRYGLEQSYSVGGNSKAQVLRVPHFRNVTVHGVLTVHSWDGNTGGVLALRASEALRVNGGAQINLNGLGYRGYEKWPSPSETGRVGENTTSPNYTQQRQSIANGGGGGGGWGDGGAGGGGGSYATPGSDGYDRPTGGPLGGAGADDIVGHSDLQLIFYGGAGGAGGSDDSAGTWSPYPCGMGGRGGYGGGIAAIYGKTVNVLGHVIASGSSGSAGGWVCSGGAGGGGGGGGGAGGSILIRGGVISLGNNLVVAVGGSGGSGAAVAGDGGVGGDGRIRMEYCETLSGSTNPSASTQKLDCYITEQIESSPYNSARLNLPESFSSGRHYSIQYGRRHLFSAAGSWTTTLRIPAAAFTDVTLDALISEVSSGGLTFKIDVGNDGAWDWQTSPTVNGATTLVSPDLSAAFNAYWAAHGAPTSGTVDVPVKIYLSKAGQVLLTNLQVTPTGSKIRYVRLPAETHDSVTLDLTVGTSGSGPLTLAADVGDDGSVDWTYTGDVAYPHHRVTANLAAAFNSYLSGHTGEVDVPVRFYLAPFTTLHLESFSSALAGRADLSLTTTDIVCGTASPVEGDTVPLTATLHNIGDLASSGLTAAFYATVPGWGEWYVGSDYVPVVPAGGTAQASISWSTLGFTGTVPVRVVVDPYDRVPEDSETNNEASTDITILTRPDLRIPAITLSDDEPMAGENVTVELAVHNAGQATAGAQTVQLQADDADVGMENLVPLDGGTDGTATFSWMPSSPGPYRLYGLSDVDDVVNEYDEGNNHIWRDVYVGFPSPLLLDSGTAADPIYTSTTGYGYVDTGAPDATVSCGAGSEPYETLRRDPDGQVVYRFDHLLPGHFYHLDITLYECDGAGRQESIYVDGNLVAGPEDLGDGEVHRLSLRLDPALYADYKIEVLVEAPGIDGAVVSEVKLYDVDYRYADAGGGHDPAYPAAAAELPYGWVDTSVANISWGTLPYQSVRVDQNDNELTYRFDGLESDKRYNVHFTFWQPSGTGRIQRVRIDGLDTGLKVDLGDYQLHRETIPVMPGAYSNDGSIDVTIGRLVADTGAMVNEIAIEEETLPLSGECEVQETPYFSDVYGSVRVLDQAAPAGTVVQAISPRGDVVGCFVVGNSGQYGFMRIYGEDTSAAAPIPGMRDGELVAFTVSGAPAVATPLFYWSNDHATHQVDLNAVASEGQALLLSPGWNLFSFRFEPPVPLVRQVLSSIDGKYDRVLGERGIFAPHLADTYNTLHELHTGEGYYARITSTTSINALIEGVSVPVTTPILLHSGWNWIGYRPETSLPITTALQSVDGHYQRVLSLDKTYDPSLPDYSTLQEMQPGEGYLIYATDVVTLVYPAGASQARAAVTAKGVAPGCSEVAPTPYLSLLYGRLTINDAPAPVGTRVEVMTPRGEVAGCFRTAASGHFGILHVYGEDSTADPRIPGFREGESLSIHINGVPVEGVDMTWHNDRELHEVQLETTIRSLFLPLVLKDR